MVSFFGDDPYGQAYQREEVLVALITATDCPSEVVRIASEAKTASEIRSALMTAFALNERQAQVVIELRVSGLCMMERAKIGQELVEIREYTSKKAETPE